MLETILLIATVSFIVISGALFVVLPLFLTYSTYKEFTELKNDSKFKACMMSLVSLIISFPIAFFFSMIVALFTLLPANFIVWLAT